MTGKLRGLPRVVVSVSLLAAGALLSWTTAHGQAQQDDLVNRCRSRERETEEKTAQVLEPLAAGEAGSPSSERQRKVAEATAAIAQLFGELRDCIAQTEAAVQRNQDRRAAAVLTQLKKNTEEAEKQALAILAKIRADIPTPLPSPSPSTTAAPRTPAPGQGGSAVKSRTKADEEEPFEKF